MRAPEVIRLMDGRVVQLRPIEESDAAALVRFHEALSHHTTRLRYFSVHPHLSGDEVERFTHVDHHEREAVVLVRGEEIIGVGRFDRVLDTVDAEVAFVVADDWQGVGAGSILLERLAELARAEGIDRFVADTLGENHRMARVFERSGMVAARHWDAGVLHLEMELDGRLALEPLS